MRPETIGAHRMATARNALDAGTHFCSGCRHLFVREWIVDFVKASSKDGDNKVRLVPRRSDGVGLVCMKDGHGIVTQMPDASVEPASFVRAAACPGREGGEPIMELFRERGLFGDLLPRDDAAIRKMLGSRLVDD